MGRSGFEPLKSKDDGFTVRCIWPLCNLPMFINWIIKKYFTPVLLWSWWSELSGQPSVYKSVALPFSLHQFFCGAGGRNWAGNRLFTSQLLYPFRYTSFVVELVVGIEWATVWLQVSCLPFLIHQFLLWSWWSESNQQPSDYKSDALPLSHTSIENSRFSRILVPRGGIEPPTQGFSVPCSTDWATEA